MWLNCKVKKKWQPPHFYINPPFWGLYPLSSKKFRTPQSDSIFGRSYPPPPSNPSFLIRGREGVPTMLTLFGQVWSKKRKNCIVKKNIGAFSNLKKLNLMMIFIFSVTLFTFGFLFVVCHAVANLIQLGTSFRCWVSARF